MAYDLSLQAWRDLNDLQTGERPDRQSLKTLKTTREGEARELTDEAVIEKVREGYHVRFSLVDISNGTEVYKGEKPARV